eukprot:TRINITY_DN3086_c0_g1_i6.p1 TRINITY_DN3086_c0_g1~~TRINITY_DN3086_c0_g1_i6.p1  ORF type:complete len:231 (-),score=17.57 TRINITY_DN3086_c0_g1_i6:108-800(-)
MKNFYPYMVLNSAPKKQKEAYPELPIELPEYPPFQPMQIATPKPYFMPYIPSQELEMDTMKIVILVCLCLFAAWDILVTLANFSTLIFLLQNLNILSILIVAFFFISMLLKFFTMIMAVLPLIGKPITTPYSSILIFGVIGCLAGFAGVEFWAFQNLSIGVNIGLILDYALYAVVGILAWMKRTQSPTMRYLLPLQDHSIQSTFHSHNTCLLYTSPSPRDLSTSRMPSSA